MRLVLFSFILLMSTNSFAQSLMERRIAGQKAERDPANASYIQAFMRMTNAPSTAAVNKCTKQSGKQIPFHYVANITADGTITEVAGDSDSSFANCYMKEFSEIKAPKLPAHIKAPFPIQITLEFRN